MRDWTALSINAQGEGTISVIADDLEIVSDSNEFEERVLTLNATYSTTKEFNEEYHFKVKNLSAIPKVTKTSSLFDGKVIVTNT